VNLLTHSSAHLLRTCTVLNTKEIKIKISSHRHLGALYPFYSHHVHAVCRRIAFGRNQNTNLCEQPLTRSVECARVVNTVSHMCSRHVRYIQCRYAFLPNGTVESPVPSRTPTMPCQPEALLAHPLNVISGSISAYNFENEDFLYESPVYR
jgi:hypothetical protein